MSTELEKNLDTLNIHGDAKTYLLDLYDVIQGLDDWYDEDALSKEAKAETIYKVMVLLPTNPFYVQHSAALATSVNSLVMKWIAANSAEEAKEHDEVSFVWRASYFDTVYLVFQLLYGYEAASKIGKYIMKMYSENFNTYDEEINNA